MATRFLLSAFIILWLSGCQAKVPMWRPEAGAALEKLRRSGAEVLLSAEFQGVQDSFALANWYMEDGNRGNAEKQYLLTLRNAEALEKKLFEEKTRLDEIRLKENAVQKEQEPQKAPEENSAEQEEGKGDSSEKPRKNKERALAVTHTVKRGETLPYIASLPEVFNDPGLWPLLYRANRDQIRDPNYIWPGQVLRIPRNTSRQNTANGGKSAQE